jgi:hypothetical protein
MDQDPAGTSVPDTSGKLRSSNDGDLSKPSRPLRAGLAERHEALEITPSTRAYARNSVLAPGIDMETEVDAINQGGAVRLTGNRYRINNRIWIDKGDGYTFPETGEDVWEFSAAQFNLLKVLIQDGGRSLRADKMIANNPRLDDQLAGEVERFFDSIQEYRKREQDSSCTTPASMPND